MLLASKGSTSHPSSFLFYFRVHYLVHSSVMDHQLLVLKPFDSFLVPSKDDSLHPAPQAIVQLDPQLLVVEVEVESELGLA